MKDYNYYKIISDICNEANDVYKKFKINEIIPSDKISLNDEADEGDSFILISEKNKYLMVETSTNFNWVSSRLMLYEINNIDGNFAKYLHDWEQEDHNGKRHKLFVFSYIEGVALKDYLLKVDNKEAYNLGKELGNTIKKVHLIKVDVLNHHVSNWNAKYNWIQKDIFKNYIPKKEQEKAFNFYKENKEIIKERYSSSEYYQKINGNYVLDENGNYIIEKVLSFIFGGIRLENLIVANNKVYVKCPINIEISDPFYDFRFLPLIALENEHFAKGIIDGYFEDKISMDFFKMLKYYICELIIKDFNGLFDSDVITKIYNSYDNFKLEIPKWYNQ